MGLIIALAGCSAISPGGDSSDFSSTVQMDVANAHPSQVTADVSRQSASLHHFMVGQLELNQEEYASALQHFAQSESLLNEPAAILHTKMADLYVRFGELDKALVAADKALSEKPQDPYVRLLYAGVLEALGRTSEAEPMYRKLMEEFPAKFDSYVLLANLYAKQQRFDEAVGVLRDLIVVQPREPIAHYYLGRMFEQMGQLGEAEKEYDFVVEREAGTSNGMAELLRVLLKQKKSEKARNVCERILEKDPNNALARKVLSHIMLGQSQLDGALAHLQVLETLEQDATDTRFKIALIQIEKQNYKEAERELNFVLATNPNHSEARYYLASMLASAGKTKEAVDELFRIEKDSQMFVRSRTFAAFILRQGNERKRALRAVREGLEVEPQNVNLSLYEVLILRDLGRYAEAKTQLQRSLKRSPDDERLLFNLGLILGDQGDIAESIKAMERVLAVSPKNSDAMNFIAYALVESGGDLERASGLVHMALENKPRDGFYLDTLGWIQFKQGKVSEAEATLAQAVSLSGEDLIVVEHYLEVLIAEGSLAKAVGIMKGVAEQGVGREDSRDEEKSEAYKRIQKRLDSILQAHPELRSIQRSELGRWPQAA
jgi:tetratricopeptide (TPR) repeat protein